MAYGATGSRAELLLPPQADASSWDPFTRAGKALAGITYELGIGAGISLISTLLGYGSLSLPAALSIGALAMPAATLLTPPLAMMANGLLSYIEERPFILRFFALAVGCTIYNMKSTCPEYAAIGEALQKFIARTSKTEEVFLESDDVPLVTRITEYLNLDPDSIVTDDTVSEMLVVFAKTVKMRGLFFPTDVRTVFSAANRTSLDPKPIRVSAFTAETPESNTTIPEGYRKLPAEFLEGGEYAHTASDRIKTIRTAEKTLHNDAIFNWGLVVEISIALALLTPKMEKKLLSFMIENVYRKILVDIPGTLFDEFFRKNHWPSFSEMMGKYMNVWANILERLGCSHAREIELSLTDPEKLAHLVKTTVLLSDTHKLRWCERLKRDLNRMRYAFRIPPEPGIIDSAAHHNLNIQDLEYFHEMILECRDDSTAKRFTYEAIAHDRFEKYGIYGEDILFLDCLRALPGIADESHLEPICQYYFLTDFMGNNEEISEILLKYRSQDPDNRVTSTEIHTLLNNFFGGKLSWVGQMQCGRSRPQMWHHFNTIFNPEPTEPRVRLDLSAIDEQFLGAIGRPQSPPSLRRGAAL